MNTFNTFKTLESGKFNNLLTLFLSGLSFWIGTTVFLPILSPYIKDQGATQQQVGFVMGCFAIGLLLFRSQLGKLADQRSRKLVVLIGTAVAATAPLGYLFVQSIPGLMAVRAFHGISVAAFTTGYSALVVDISPAKQRGEIIGYMSLVVPIGMAIGPALGGTLELTRGYNSIFIVAACAGFLSLFLASRINETKETQSLTKESFPSQRRSFRQLIQTPSLSVLALMLLLVGIVFGNIIIFLPLYLKELDSGFNAGLFYTAAAISSFVVRIFTGKASDRHGRGLFITVSLAVYAISMLMLATATNSTVVLLAAILEGAGIGAVMPIMIALMSDRSYANERGKVYSLCIGGFDLGGAIAGPILGLLAPLLNYQGLFFVSAGLVFASLLVFMTSSSKNIPHSFRFAFGLERDAYALDR